jgi:two-component system sensor histidine kinase RegB
VLGFRIGFYAAVCGLVLLAPRVFGVAVPEAPLLVIAGTASLLSPLARPRLERRGVLEALLVFDVLALTALLALAGGPLNPFTLLYFVQVTLAAVIASPLGVALVVGAASLGYGSLFWLVGQGEDGGHADALTAHLQGMWVAFTLAALIIGGFVSRLSQAFLREREMRARTSRLLGLTTLAAGAAHEIGNPLGTIKIVAADLERELREARRDDQAEDARVIVEEVERARGVLERMATGAGEMAGEGPRRLSVGDVLAEVEARLGGDRARVEVDARPSDLEIRVPVHALSQALAQLVRNGLQSSPADRAVRLDAWGDARSVRFVVRDRGRGMSADVLERVGEPFFTTRPQGEGTGLGVFLARALAEQLGGALRFRSTPGEGTEATLLLPRWPSSWPADPRPRPRRSGTSPEAP